MTSFRYAHSEGHTDICYTDDFRRIITCGSEGDVRVWESANDSDQKDLCVGEAATAVIHKGKNFYVGTDRNVVQAYTLPGLETDGIISRFTAPVTQIDVAPSGQKLVAGSCDMEIHVVDLHTLSRTVLRGHKAPVLSVAFDPLGEFIASSSCDGSVRIWALSNEEVVKQWDIVEKSNSFETAPSICRIHFSCGGKLLALPVKDSIQVYDRSWKLVKTLTFNGATVNIAKFSPDGKFLAGGTSNGRVTIWDYEKEKVVHEANDPSERAVTAIAWSKGSSLVYCNKGGYLAEIEVDTKVPEEVENPEDEPLAVPEFDDDEDDENVISLEKIKNQSGFGLPEYEDDKATDADKESVTSEPRAPRFSLPEPQAPFQPSSTPEHLLQRFMVWNNTGIVRQFNTEESNEIDIEFHDASIHHSFRINNLLGHTMATLTPQCLLLACPKADVSSKVVCILLKSSDGQKEWDCSLGEEEATALAAGQGWVAVATDAGCIRLFTVDGTQCDIFSIPGPVVCMSGCLDTLFVVFHTGSGIKDPSMGFFRLTITRQKVFMCRQSGFFPMSPGSSLKWIGFSDEGSLAAMDSTGMLRLLYDKVWRPICSMDENRKSILDHYFVIGVNESSQKIRCILCRGSYYPPVLPKPIVTEVGFKVPLCELEAEKGKLEEEMLRNLLTLPNIQGEDYEADQKTIEKAISVTMMKLFALACRSGLEARAISLCETMTSPDVVKLASKYAAKVGRHQLANRIMEIAARATQEEERVVEACDDEDPGYSQDMFADSPTPRLEESFVVQMRKKTAPPSPKPTKIVKRDNPFTKKKENIPSNDAKTGDRITFMDWFSKNRESLQAEFPLLKEGELAIAGMKKYRKEMAGVANLNESMEEPGKSTEIVKDKKRKSSPSTEDGGPAKKVSALSKLKAFSFTSSKS